MTGLDEEARYRAIQALDPKLHESLEPMVRGLYDDSWRVRRAASEQLARRTDEDTLWRLREVLADQGQTGARNAAADALVRMGDRAVETAIDLLGHADPDQRRFAAEILGQLRHGSALVPLLSSIEDPDLNVQVAAVEALGALGGNEAGRALERLLQGTPTLLRLAVLEALAKLGRAPPLPTLVALVEDVRLRRSGLRLLGLVRDPAAHRLLAEGLRASTASIREAALYGLGKRLLSAPARERELEATLRTELSRAPMPAGALEEALRVEPLEVRAGALLVASAIGAVALVREIAEVAREEVLFEKVAACLARLGAPAARPLLARFSELSAPARAAAGAALLQVSDPSLIASFEQLFASGDHDAQLFAVQAVSRVQSPEAVLLLVPMLEDEAIAGPAARALVSLGRVFPDATAEALRARLEGGHPSAAAISALAQVAPARLAPLLPRLARHERAEVRAAALAGAEELELCRAGLSDEVAEVREAAVRALGRCKGAEAVSLLRSVLEGSDEGMRLAAIDAVGERGDRSLSAELERVATSEEGFCAARAVRALARLGPVSEAVLRRAGAHPDAEVVKEALAAGAVRPEGVALALGLLRDPRWDVRAAAARVLGTSGGASARAEVEAALASETDPLVHDALTDARERLRGR